MTTRRRVPIQVSEDKILVARLLAGEEAAFDQFFADHFDGLYRFALTRLGHDEGIAKEIVQCTVLSALEGLDKYRGEAALFTWLCSICRFEISAYFRRQKRQPTQVELSEEAPEIRAVLDDLAAGLEGAEESLQRAETVRLVHLTLDHLPARYGRALEWKYIDGLPVREIASRLALSPKAAESVLTRARLAFRTGFEALCQNLEGGGGNGLHLVSQGRRA